MINKTRLKQKLSRAGIHVQSASSARPVDLTDTFDPHPIEAIYAAQGRPALLRVPLWRCRHFSWMAFPCTFDSPSPFIQTLVEYDKGNSTGYEGSPLESYYQRFQPASAAEVMGLAEPFYSVFRNLRPEAAPLPWRSVTPEQAALVTTKSNQKGNREHAGRQTQIKGSQLYGPVSCQKGRLEHARLVKIYQSLESHGFLSDYEGMDNITAVCLYSKKAQDWRYHICAGQHRTAAATALGYTEITLQLRSEGLGGLVSEDEAERWPNVRKGYFDKKEAVCLFSQLFEGGSLQ